MDDVLGARRFLQIFQSVTQSPLDGGCSGRTVELQRYLGEILLDRRMAEREDCGAKPAAVATAQPITAPFLFPRTEGGLCLHGQVDLKLNT
jgi:hypothetical protein